MTRRCAACGGESRGRFCAKCGAELPGPPPPPSAPPVAREDAWTHLQPVFGMMGVLLLVQAAAFFWTKLNPTREARADLFATLGIVAGSVVFGIRERVEIRALLRWPRVSPRELGWLLFAVCTGALVVCAYFALTARVPGMTFLDPGDGTSSARVLVLYCVAAPLSEELAFRGFAQTRLARVLSPREAVAVQAALFSVLHLLPLMYVSHFVLGYVFGEVRRVTRSLYPSVVLHAGWNLMVLLWSASYALAHYSPPA